MGQKELEIPASYYILRQSLYRFSNDFNTSSKFLFRLNISGKSSKIHCAPIYDWLLSLYPDANV